VYPEVRYNLGQEKHLSDLIDPLNELDELSWGFRIEKMQERGATAMWHVFFVNPHNTMWISRADVNLAVALKTAVKFLKEYNIALSNGSFPKIDYDEKDLS